MWVLLGEIYLKKFEFLLDKSHFITEVSVVELESIGRNVRRYRLKKKLRQEDLAELAGLSINYVGAVEHGEKIPSLETLIVLINALEVSADMVLADVVSVGYTVKDSLLAEKLDKLDPEDRRKIYDVIDTMVKNSKQIKP